MLLFVVCLSLLFVVWCVALHDGVYELCVRCVLLCLCVVCTCLFRVSLLIVFDACCLIFAV